MSRSIAMFAIAALVAITALFDAHAAKACQSVTVYNNTGCNVIIRMYDMLNQTRDFPIPAGGGTIINPNNGFNPVGFMTNAGTKIPVPAADTCFRCVVLPPMAGSQPCCVEFCSTPSNCTITLNAVTCDPNCVP